MADKQQIWTRDLTGADVLRLLLAAEAEIVPPNQRMASVFWPLVARWVMTGLVADGTLNREVQQTWTRDLTGADVLRLARAFEAELVPPARRMNPVFWPSVAEGVPIGLILEGVIKYPPIEVEL